MAILITTFPDGSALSFDQGRFDDWCVYVSVPNGTRFAPTDREYFADLQRLAAAHGATKIYRHFVAIYELTNQELNPHVLALIENQSQEYGADALKIRRLLSIMYAGMVAEENRAHTRLGKRVKRLGLHQTLLERLPAHIAANFSKGKRWQAIARECVQRGF